MRERQLLSLAAVHKSTAAPADRLGLRRRGRVAVGMAADLAVFNLERVQEHATWTDPCRLSSGVRHVWINGQHVISEGVLTGVQPGRVLRRHAD